MVLSARLWIPYALTLAPACFNPDYHCRLICEEETSACPPGYQCVNSGSQHLCQLKSGPACPASPQPAEPDAAVLGMDASADVAGAPEQLCYHNSCLTLTPALRAGLVLWLDPSTLPPAGVGVDVWPDRSGMVNHALAVDPSVRPASVADGVNFVEGNLGSGFRIAHNSGLDPADGAFSVYIVVRMRTTSPKCLITKSNNERGQLLRRLSLDLVYSEPIGEIVPTGFLNDKMLPVGAAGNWGDLTRHLVGLVRTGDELHLRLDGAARARPLAVPAGLTVSNAEDVFLGICGPNSSPIFGMNGAVVVRGEIPADDLLVLERFLMNAFSISTAM